MAPENSIAHMPDHITPHELPFLSRSEPGWGQEDVIEENIQLFQDTEPFDEVVAPDSYPDETQCQLDYDAEVIIEDVGCGENENNNPVAELEREVALDSEDDPDCSVGKGRSDNTKSDFKVDRIVKRKRIGVFKMVACSPSLQIKGPLADIKSGTGTYDQVSAGSNVIGAEEPENSSQDNALDFVDSYLSHHEVVFSPKQKPRDVCEKVTPASGLKGCQSLAKQISSRTPDGIEETFEWVDNSHYKKISFSEDSRNTAGSRKQIKKKEQLCPVSIDKNQVIVEQYSDVGIGTQMAAEAMEALSNGLAIDRSVNQCLENLFVDSPTPLTKSQARKSSTRNRTSSSHLRQPCYQELDNEPKKAAKRKSSKVMVGRLKRRGNAPQKECSTGKCLNPVKKRKESELESKYNNEESQDHRSLSSPSRNNSPEKNCLQRESLDHQTGNGMKDQMLEGTKDESHNKISKSSIITYKRKRTDLKTKPSIALNAGMCSKQLEQRETFSEQVEHNVAGCDMARTEDGRNIPQPQERMKETDKVCLITYQRKKHLLSAKFSEVPASERKNSTLSSLASSLYIRTWIFTKGKRTLRKRPSHCNAAGNQIYLSMFFYEKENYKRPCNKIVPKSSILRELVKLGNPDQEPDFKLKDSRKRRDMASTKVLFSQHLDDDILKQQKRILARFHISIASCPMDATHFVADKFTRTMNMLETMALGKPVVTHLWLESCAQASCLVDEKNYFLRDAKKEKEFGFSMPVSLAHAQQHPLLEGRQVLITPNVRPDKDRISSLVKAAGGQATEKAQISLLKIPDDLLILSCEEDEDICVPFLHKGVVVYSSELLLSGIIIQKLEYERHQLFTKYSQRNRRGRKG